MKAFLLPLEVLWKKNTKENHIISDYHAEVP